jgi:hypothetical protein
VLDGGLFSKQYVYLHSEMPIEEARLKLKLPIDQVEWLKNQKTMDLNDVFKEMIYELWKSKDIKS